MMILVSDFIEDNQGRTDSKIYFLLILYFNIQFNFCFYPFPDSYYQLVVPLISEPLNSCLVYLLLYVPFVFIGANKITDLTSAFHIKTILG